MKTAVFSVIYTQALMFFQDFLASLAAQSDHDFELFLVNDGIPDMDRILSGMKCASRLSIRLIEAQGSPVEIRKIGLDALLDQGYDTVVFADADDRMASNRIERLKYLLFQYPLVFNELIRFGDGIEQSRSWLSNRFLDGQEIGFSDLIESNCLGLTNTALRTDTLVQRGYAQIPADQLAFDWDFFSYIIYFQDITARFTAETYTEYRQHRGNLGSSAGPQGEAYVLDGLKVKSQHYHFLARFFPEAEKLYRTFSDLVRQFENDAHFRKWYTKQVVQKNLDSALWWEKIVVMSLEE